VRVAALLSQNLIAPMDTISVMAIQRVTRQVLTVLAVLLDAYVRDEGLHGYAIKKMTGLSGPSTYRVLDRLQDAQLADVWWEQLPEGDERPRRRYYRLNSAGAATARKLLAERRPDALEGIGRTPPLPAAEPKPGFGTLFGAVLALIGGGE
jgi:DNA-binding PadR family transcriptional regulator